MKNLAILVLFVAALSLTFADDRVQISLYFESLCPGCREFITGTFKTAVYTEGFDKICNYQLFPYGNAHQRQVGGQWVFTCQHGEEECEGNLLENCVLAKLPFNTNYKFVICLEEIIDSVSGWNQAAQQCAKEFNVDLKAVNECIANQEGNDLVHRTADATDALNPPHKYVPWITYDGTHSSSTEQQIENNMVAFVCSKYTGPEKIAACKNTVGFSGARAAYKPIETCARGSLIADLLNALLGRE